MRALRRVLTALGLLLIAVVAWSSWRAWQVRSDLLDASQAAVRVQSLLADGNADQAQAALPRLRSQLDQAERRTSGPAWSTAEHIPLLGASFDAVRRVARAGQLIGDQALPQATEALAEAHRGRLIDHGRVDLALLRSLGDRVRTAASATATAQRLVGPKPWYLLPFVASGIDEARQTTTRLNDQIDAARRALSVAVPMLGSAGPRHYLVAVQNLAEARATGGLVGAFALISTDRGTVHVDRTGINDELPVLDRLVSVDPQAAKTWINLGSGSAWYDVNLTPHFPDAARNLAGLWRAKTGQQLDGLFALDAVVMSDLMRVTGPVALPDGTTVSADSVGSFVGADEYVRYPDVAQRKGIVGELAAELFRRVLAGSDPQALLRAITSASGSGHLFAWSNHVREQTEIQRGMVGGALPPDNRPYLAVLTQNFGGDKLDYYLRRTVSVTKAPHGKVRVLIRLRNIAPLGLPAYVTVRSDRLDHPPPYAQARVALSVYGALTSEVDEVTLNGHKFGFGFDRDHGHRMGTMDVEVPRNRTITVTLLISEPKGTIEYRQQPLVVPDQIDSRVPLRVVGR